MSPLSCGVVAQNMYGMLHGIEDGTLYYPLGDGELAHVDVDDIGKVGQRVSPNAPPGGSLHPAKPCVLCTLPSAHSRFTQQSHFPHPHQLSLTSKISRCLPRLSHIHARALPTLAVASAVCGVYPGQPGAPCRQDVQPYW